MCITACGEDTSVGHSDYYSRYFRIMGIRVQDGNGLVLPNKTVYVFSDEFPITYTNVLFSDDSIFSDDIVFKKENAVDSAITKDSGEIGVVFSKEKNGYEDVFINFYDALSHKYYFIVFDDEQKPHGFDYFVGIDEDGNPFIKTIVLP